MADGKVVIETEIDNRGAEQDLKQLGTQVKNSTEKSADHISRLAKRLNEEVGNGTRSVKSAVSVLAQEYKKSGESASSAYQKAWASIERSSNSGSEKTKDDLERIGHAAEQASKRVKDSLGNALSKLGSLAKTGLKTTATAIAAAGTALAGLGGAAIKVGMDFEAAMSEVQAIAGASAQELQALTEKAKEMGANTKFSASESAQALKYMAMAGWETQDMLNGIDGVMNLAAASGEDLALVSDIVTDALTAFGLKAKDAGHFADVLAKAATSSNTDVAKMGNTFQYVAPVAGTFGYSVEDTAVAIGLLASSGIKAESAGTALRGIFTNLAKPTNQVASYMKELGISMTDTAGNVKPLSQLMQELRRAFSGLTEAQKAEYAAGLAGREGMSGLLAIVNASEEDFSKLTQQINHCNGAAEEIASTMQDNLKGRITQLKSALEGLGIQFYESVDTPLKSIAESAIKMVGELSQAFSQGGLSGFVEKLGDVFAQIAVKAAEAAPDILEAGKNLLLAFLDGIQKNSAKITGAIAEIGKVLLAAVVQLVPKVAELGKDLIVGFVKAILGANAAKSVRKMLDGVLDVFRSLWQAVQKIWAAIRPILSNLIQILSNLAGAVLPVVSGAIRALADNAQALVPLVTAAVAAFAAFKILSTVTSLINTAKAAYTAFQLALSATNPVTLALGALTALAGFLAGIFLSSTNEAAEATARLEDSQEQLGSTLCGIEDDIRAFESGIANSTATLADFGDSVIVSAEKQQKLADEMEQVQKEITAIAGTYSEGRKDLTQAEIQRLEDLFEKMRVLAQQQLEIQKSYQQVTKGYATGLANGSIESLEVYEKQAQDMLKVAEEAKNKVVEFARQQAMEEIALIRLRTDITEDEIQSLIDAKVAETNETIAAAEREYQETIAIVQAGYAQRSDAYLQFIRDYDALQKEHEANIEDNNNRIRIQEQQRQNDRDDFWGGIFNNDSQYNKRIEELRKDNENLEAAHNEKLKALWTEEVEAQAAANLKMAAQQLELNGTLSGEAAQMVESILTVYDRLSDEQKEKFRQACQGSLDTVLKYQPVVETAAKEFGRGLPQGTAAGIQAGSVKLSQATQQMIADTMAQMEDSPEKAMVIGAQIAQGVAQGIESQKQAIRKAAEGAANAAAISMKAVLDIHSPSRVMRDEVGKNIALGVAEGIDKNAKAAAQSAAELGSLVLQSAEKTLSNYKIYHDVLLADEVAYWDEVRKQCVSRSQARMDADKKYFDAKTKLNDQMVALEKDYASKVKTVHENLQKDIEKLVDSYNDKVESRAKSIASSMSLFSEFTVKDVDGQDLLHNLQTQVDGLTDWTVNLEALKSRGLDKNLLEELQEMGTGAAGEVEALLHLSDRQLDEYTALWRQKQKLAKSQALSELAPQRQEISAQIQELTRQANQDLQDYQKEYVEAMQALGVAIQQPIEQLKTTVLTDGSVVVQNFCGAIESTAALPEILAKFEVPATAVSSAMAVIPGQMQQTGAQIVDSLIAGMLSRETSLNEAVARLQAAVALETGAGANLSAVATHRAQSAAPASTGNATQSGSGPGMVETHIYINDREAAVALTPAISKELGWKGNR